MRKTTLIIFVIIVIAAFFRFYEIDHNPKAMYGDGLTLVYDAYSILKTGHDQKGEFLPLVFSLGGGRPAGYVYATIPFVALFGPTAFAGAIVSVLSGIGIVMLLYLLGRKLFSEEIGLATAAIAALNPWELSLSRGPFETHFALFLTLLGIYSFIKGLKNQFWFIIFGLCFGLASQTYSTYKLTIPVLVFLLIFFRKNLIKFQKKDFNLKKPLFIISLIVITFSTILSVYLTVSRGNQDRFDIINIFKDPSLRSTISQKVNAERTLDSLSPSISNSIHTPQIELIGVLSENYIQNLLPDFLYIHGDGQVRHNPAEMGGFFFIDALLLIIGIIYLYKNKKNLLLFLTSWIVLAPIPTSLVGGPHALRSSLLLPPVLILTGTGLWYLLSLRKKLHTKLLLIFLAMLFVVQFIYFVDRFYFVSPQKNTKSWSLPAKTASEIALENKQNFGTVILSNDIDNMEFAFPVYAKLDPNLVINQNKSSFKIGEFRFFKYGNVYIGSLPHSRIMQFIEELPGSVMYIGSDKEEKDLKNYKLIRGFDNQVDLVITSKNR